MTTNDRLAKGKYGVLLLASLMTAGQVAWGMSCGELRLLSAEGVIGPEQRYTASARCGEQKMIDHGTKWTWLGPGSSSATNFSFWIDVVGKAAWDRKTGVATETLEFTGNASGERVSKGTCNQDPFLKDPPGGAAICHNVTAQSKLVSGPVYTWFSEPVFFLAGRISLLEAQALSQQQGGSSPPPPPPPPKPVHPMMSSPSGSRVWEGESFLDGGKSVLDGGKVSAQPMGPFGREWSGDSQLLWTGGQKGAVLDLHVDAKTAGLYQVILALTTGPDYGIVQAEVAGTQSAVKFDGYSRGVSRNGAVDLGNFPLQAGPCNLSLMIIGKNPQSTGYLVGVDRITLKPVKGQKINRSGSSQAPPPDPPHP